MTPKNSYPELPEIPFERTSVQMPVVVDFAKSLLGKYDDEFVVMAYAIFRNESANGTKGVNNNYAGIQADVGRWSELPGTPIGTSVKVDSGGANRRFLCFGEDGYKISFELICIKAAGRNMKTAQDYYEKWVCRAPNEDELKNFNSLLRSGVKNVLR